MLSHRKRAAGFTLPEVLVTVAIVAVLAAAVVPTVVNQMSKGETGAVVADLNSLSSGITSFVTDTRRYPGKLEHLNTRPTPSNAGFLDLNGAQYNNQSVNSWKGPYLSTTQTLSAGYNFAGLNLQASNVIVAPALLNGFHITLTIVKAGGGSFTPAELVAIDQTLDGGDGTSTPNCASPSSGSTSGRLQWTETPATPCTVTAVQYRLVPTGS